MFPRADVEHTAEDLLGLARAMFDHDGVESLSPADPTNNATLPAGYTYLGQFIDHDLTFDAVPSFVELNDPARRLNLRTPRFDLDSLYGAGPADSPFMYEPDPAHGGQRVRLAIGRDGADGSDLPRYAGRAIIGDPRNDENLIVSQLHLAFLAYHNQVVGSLPRASDVFETARGIVRRHYQWL